MRGARLILLASFVASSAVARAAAPDGDQSRSRMDDPKMTRRLKTRLMLPANRAANPPAPASVAAGVNPAPASPVSDPREVVVSTPASTGVSSGLSSGLASGVSSSAGETASSEGRRPSRGAGRVPAIGIGYRRFSFVQLGATNSGSTAGAAVSEPFDSLSLDFYPVSRFIRFGLSTQYGWQNGQFNSGTGDYFFAQSASLGIQSAGPRVTPFAEALAGGGYMRRFQFDRTIPTAYWQFGVDAGANFFLADHGYVSLALGYLRPVNGFLKQQTFTSVYVDTWSVKIGFGL